MRLTRREDTTNEGTAYRILGGEVSESAEEEGTHLQESSSEDIASLVAEFRNLATRRSRLSSLLLATMFASILPLYALSMYINSLGFAASNPMNWLWTLQAGVPIGLGTWMSHLAHPSRRQSAIARTLLQIEDPAAVIPILNTLGFGQRSTRDTTALALCRLLPKLGEEHFGLFSPRNIQHLNVLLRPSSSAINRKLVGRRWDELRLAVVVALGAVGDHTSIDAVLALTTEPPTSDAEARIQAAADQSLARLRLRVKRQETAGSLLRPADESGAKGAGLLRPAGNTGSERGEVLLRPAEDE